MERKMISDALQGGDDHGDAGVSRRRDEACGMEHAFRTEERTAAKLEGRRRSGVVLGTPPAQCTRMAQRRGACFRC